MPAPTVTPATPSIHQAGVYHPDPQHLWNRLFRHFYVRTTRDGRAYGQDALDPLLWHETTYLLEGPSYEQAMALLDEFLSTHGEELITDPLKRAMLQRDLWAVFDRTTLRPDDHPDQRRALQRRLAQVIRRLALSRAEIQSLPDNYQAAVDAGAFPGSYRSEHPETAFLPPDLFQPDGGWVNIGREGGPIAITHVRSFPFFGRSMFLVFIRVPGGREATLDYVQQLRATEDFAQGKRSEGHKLDLT